MPKRLTAEQLGEFGPIGFDKLGKSVLIEVRIMGSATHGNVKLSIGGDVVETTSERLRRAAIEAEMKEPGL